MHPLLLPLKIRIIKRYLIYLVISYAEVISYILRGIGEIVNRVYLAQFNFFCNVRVPLVDSQVANKLNLKGSSCGTVTKIFLYEHSANKCAQGGA